MCHNKLISFSSSYEYNGSIAKASELMRAHLDKSPRRELFIPVKKTRICSKFRIESHIKY